MPISLKQIRYFVSTAESGQISQAAVALSISQSAITTAIKDLEAEVGATLFSRSQQGMDLTPAGRELLFHAYEVLAKVDEMTGISVPGSDLAGTLSVAASYTVIGYYLPHHLERLRRNFPQLDIQLFELNREAIEEGLLANRYDIAVMLTANTNNPDLSTETHLSSRRRLWLPARHRLLARASVGLQDVSDEPYIMLTVDEAAHTSLKYWSKTPYRPSVRLRTSSVEAVRSLVANGQGVAILSDMVHRPWSLEGRRIETITLSDAIPAMDVGLAWKRGVTFTPAMQAFRDYFRQTYHVPMGR
ncbi:LysR family transcriptional regulator [Mesorhizobium sp. LHD-90]|uniref:LysR family transcriptional regulator n=1 Tax=Mesorhizobium sp. LHD-90 TaxID=3071414 RepID=UPI0027E15F95|nr:LysR family transcriptional regulator [Mesorhizobium sp. LHD-90]MDQ6435481.1 LysR family transcriptional regulator [Mesorhizobium sp. LHD-90]